MRRPDFKPITALTVVALSVGLGLASCGQSDAVVFREGPPPPAFNSTDASAEASPPVGDVPMCAVTTCTLPWTTCPSSQFPCDVDLRSDIANCGGCGIDCGANSPLAIRNWSCVAGQCKFGCGGFGTANCDDNPTNGCEVNVVSDPNNCGDCGVKCPENFECNMGSCINGCSTANKPDQCSGICTNVYGDDANCGACGNACDRTGPSLPPLSPDMYYGCKAGSCGQNRCNSAHRADCNNDVTDGCETAIHTNEHCRGCEDACAPGKQCVRVKGSYICVCEDDGETWCAGSCRRLDDDPQNCGGCDRVCPGLFLPHVAAACTFGVCSRKCADDYGDCDGLADNGCEVNTRVDNRNCGTCGNACSPGQVCSGGQCLVAPCDAGTPGSTTK